MRASEPLRRSISWCAIFVHAAIASGLPLPLGSVVTGANRRHAAGEARLAAKDRSTPFPCMDKACGCATAEQCLTNCCCHTPAETLAWARARGTSPTVIAALERRVRAATKAAPACCRAERARPAARSCCETKAEPACCSTAPAPQTTEPARAENRRDVAGGRVVVLRAMLACGGIVEQWLASGGSLPPAAITWSCPALPCGRIAAVDDRLEPAVSSPDPRPPRAA